ncbi:hypothetical protein ACIRYZ_23220 [Kitasatospora sp. NPDC101155]|uniref:hypothetical protein n=1 Tax=Kitasatospora sp. NPDC101155 TaxID=3364097 RepID=UPI0037F534D3
MIEQLAARRCRIVRPDGIVAWATAQHAAPSTNDFGTGTLLDAVVVRTVLVPAPVGIAGRADR